MDLFYDISFVLYSIALVSSKNECILFIHSLFLAVEIRIKWSYDEKKSVLPFENEGSKV